MVSTEIQLMDMARSKLQEAFLRKVDAEGFQRMRTDLEYAIRQAAKDIAIQDLLPQPSFPGTFSQAILDAIDREPLDSLFHLDC